MSKNRPLNSNNKSFSGLTLRREKKKQKETLSPVVDSENGETLASRLLIDLAKKYQNMQKTKPDFASHMNGGGSAISIMNNLRNQMIRDI
jgi:hypothetical protein